MPKLNFNVPFIDKDGKPQRKMIVDRSKTRVNENGSIFVPPVTDAEGVVQYEDVTVAELLMDATNANLPGDDKMTHADRLARGKLVRKLNDKTPNSDKNWTVDELVMIKDVITRGQATPAFLFAVEEIIEADPKASGSKGKKKAA